MKKHTYFVTGMDGDKLRYTVIETDYNAMTPKGIRKLIDDLRSVHKSFFMLNIIELGQDEESEKEG